LIKVHYMNVWKYHNEISVYNEYMIIKREKNKSKNVICINNLNVVFK
jgi:hypothetical protein